MDRRILVLDIVLVLILTTLVVQLRRGWLEYEATHDPARVQPEEEIDMPITGGEGLDGAVDDQDWSAVSVLNPFSPDRNDIPVLLPVTGEEAARTATRAPPPVLIGTMLLGDERVAMLGPRDSGAYGPVRVGEVIDGWRLVEIGRKTAVVAANGERQDVVMNDPTIAIERPLLRTEAARVPAPEVRSETPPAAVAPRPIPAAPTPSTPAPQTTGPRVIQTPFGPTTVPN
jgi:hypothetical protein